mgnify:CR=1 FL=1
MISVLVICNTGGRVAKSQLPDPHTGNLCINNIINNNSVKCGITMSGEMCDNFKNRLIGAKILKI